MKIKKLLMAFGCAAFFAAVVGMFYFFHIDELGLTGFNRLIGGRSEMETLRVNTKAAADAFFSRRKNELVDSPEDVRELVVDYSKSSKIRALGHRSSFYYYCWDIYLPYSLRTRSGKTSTVVVHLSDAIPGNKHDLQKFRVLEVCLLDELGETIKRIDGK